MRLFEKMVFDEKYYSKIKSYLEENYSPREISKKISKHFGSIYGDFNREENASNIIFFHMEERVKGLLPIECILLFSKKHPDSYKIKENLGKLSIIENIKSQLNKEAIVN